VSKFPNLFHRHSLRHRVALGVILFSLFIIAVHTTAMLLVAEAREKKLADILLQEEMDLLMMGYKLNPMLHFTRSNSNPAALVVPYDVDQTQIPDELAGLPPGVYDITLARKDLRVVVNATDDARFFLMYDVADYTARLSDFRWVLIASTLAGTLFTIYLGFLLSGLLTRSVRDLAQRVENMTPGTYTDLLADNYADEEVAQLARAFDNYARKKRELVAREQEFTANVSHELRSPLTAIKSGCEILMETPSLDAAARRRLASIDDQVDRMTELLSSLLYLARERTRTHIDNLHLAEFVRRLAEDFQDSLDAKNITLHIEVADEVTLQTDKSALHIALDNLLKNAIAYSDNGSITLRYADHQLQVTDTGRGIAADELPHIFERFYRGASSRDDEDGFGLGLSIVKRVCDQNGWGISVESAPGQGTRFTLTFPNP